MNRGEGLRSAAFPGEATNELFFGTATADFAAHIGLTTETERRDADGGAKKECICIAIAFFRGEF